MKKLISTLLGLTVLLFAVHSQTTLYSEDFEGGVLIPEDITLIDHDGFTPAEGEELWTDSAWVVVTSSRPELEGTQVAAALSWYQDMGDATADDWMILPKITLGSASTLSWDAMSLTSSGNYPDDYQVIIAPYSADDDPPTVQYMFDNGTILLDQDDEWWSVSCSNPGQGLHHHDIDLTDYADQEVWIAFRQNTGDGGGYLICVDNIVVEDATSVNEITEQLHTSIYPNPADDQVTLSINLERNANAEIEVIDVTGRILNTYTIHFNAGQNNVNLNIDDLNEGLYFVNTRIEDKVVSNKLMVR